MNVRKRWKGLSIRSKARIWLATVIAVALGLVGIAAAVRSHTMTMLNQLQENDTRCYAVQEAIESERQALAVLFQADSQSNRELYHEACAATAAAIDALPFDYQEVGEERYARTWSLRSGYEGYCSFRDAFAAMDPSDPEYSSSYYRVAQIQENLASYALRLVQVTMAQGSSRFRMTQSYYDVFPVLDYIMMFIIYCAVVAILRLLDGALIRPILQMAAQSRDIAENNFSIPDLKAKNDDEVGELITAFNRMKHATEAQIATLEEKKRIESALHREEVAKLELEQNLDRTRLEMLKSQVNPHFLFNTLNMISCMARLEDAESTDRMILSLSSIFRYNLQTKEQVVLLEQELDVLDDYIYIQQTRFDGRIAYHKQIEVDPRCVWIPSFTLQPVVENAFIHGLAHREEGGRVFVRIWQKGNLLHISIADNGVGMDVEAMEALQRRIRDCEQTGRGIGLGNISRRISMLYPDGDLQVFSRPGRGTVIQCIIPQKQEGT